jgi:diaminohydroxyphosphoribosylaminopyrimidine deaminase/5-amino-6-(5-phosphoribosylamino)uracil reductase
VDKACIFLAPILIGGKTAPTAVGGEGIEEIRQALRLRDPRVERYGDDIMVEGYIVR